MKSRCGAAHEAAMRIDQPSRNNSECSAGSNWSHLRYTVHFHYAAEPCVLKHSLAHIDVL